MFIFLVGILLTIINGLIFGPEVSQNMNQTINSDGELSISFSTKKEYNAGWFGTVFTLATLLPLLSVGWRRLQDIGQPGFLIFFPAVVCGLAGLIFFLNSTPISEMPAFAQMNATTLETFETQVEAQNWPPEVKEQMVGAVRHPSPLLRIQNNQPIFVGTILIVLASFIVLIRWLALPSEDTTNKYGPNPLEVTK